LGPPNVVEATATVVKEHQVFKHTRGRCGGASDAWLLVAPLVEVVGLAESFEIGPIPEKVKANVRHIFFKEWQLRIWIPNIGGNAKGILIAVCQT
jgi:hypothetical protein